METKVRGRKTHTGLAGVVLYAAESTQRLPFPTGDLMAVRPTPKAASVDR